MPSYCWTNIFNCLSEILEFLKRKEYINTLKSCLDYSGNYNVINSAIMAKYYQNDFFIFTEKLISNCVEQMTPMIEFIIDNKMRNLYRKNNENSNSWSIGLPFSKMIVELKKYIDELLLAELIDNKIVNDILKIIDKLRKKKKIQDPDSQVKVCDRVNKNKE
ncbi:hypothetical protein HCN44_003130 [Aphidius gifuensis]|uniref:Uncharacterized protein n=1 Tax=Aphidius gifuensis TaxID=684658 RepID=A0A834XJN4_APHGI|nr:hypothetical protein HCN44_003130 [Aphidius gifuensis]